MNNIKRLREAAGITQEKLAQEIDVGRSTVAMWETDTNFPRADKLPILARILGCTIDELLSPDSE